MKDKMLTPSYIQREQEIMRELDAVREEVMANEHPTAERLQELREFHVETKGLKHADYDDTHIIMCNCTECKARTDLFAEIDALRADRATAVEALKFYADADTYVAIAIVSDPPCGDLMYDFSTVTRELDGLVVTVPGAKARAALEKLGVSDSTGRK